MAVMALLCWTVAVEPGLHCVTGFQWVVGVWFYYCCLSCMFSPQLQ